MKATQSQLLTVPDVADVLQCSPRTVYELMSSGRLVSVKVGALRRVAPAALDSYLESLIAEADALDARARSAQSVAASRAATMRAGSQR